MKNAIVHCGILLAVLVSGFAGVLSGGTIRALSDAGTLFTDAEPVRFLLAGTVPERAGYRLSNWRDEPVAEGAWPADGTLTLTGLPRGFYRLRLTDSGESCAFAIVAAPAGEGTASPGSFLGLNTSQTWLSWIFLPGTPASERYPGAAFELVARTAGKGNARFGREFFGWKDIEPEPGKFRWEKYDYNVDLLRRNGVKVTGVWRDSPGWARRAPAPGENIAPALFPDDLAASYRFARTLAERYRGKVVAWEYWNEPDAGFSNQAAWDFASAMKAASLGLRAGAPEAPVLLGSMCLYPLRSYVDAALENDLIPYIDRFNFHTYEALADYPEIVGAIRKMLARNNAGGLPVWFTEVGTYAEGAARLDSGVKGVRAHGPEQELIVAEFLPKAAILLRSLGVERVFPFVLPPFNEGGGTKDWGLLRRDYSAKPALAAFATLSRMLGDAEYRGELAAGNDVRAFLFRMPDGSQRVAFWSRSELDTDRTALPEPSVEERFVRPFRLPVPAGEYRVTDLCGTERGVSAGADGLRLESCRFPQYVSGLSGLAPSVPPPPEGVNAGTGCEFDRYVVFRTVLSDDFELSSGKDSVDFKRIPARFRLEVFNLSDTPRRGGIAVSGVSVSGIPAEVEIPAFGSVGFDLAVREAPSVPEGRIVVSGVFDGRPASRLVMPYLRVGESFYPQPLVRSGAPGAWRANSSGTMKISGDAEDRAVRFDTDFRNVENRWANSEFVLQLPQESMERVSGIEFEIRKIGDYASRYHLVMLSDDKGEMRKLVYGPPTATWETRRVFFDGVGDLSRIRILRIGLCPVKADEISFAVRNIKYLYKGKK